MDEKKLEILQGKIKTLKNLTPNEDTTTKELANIISTLIEIIMNKKEAGF